ILAAVLAKRAHLPLTQATGYTVHSSTGQPHLHEKCIVTDHVYYMHYFWGKIKMYDLFFCKIPVITAKIKRGKASNNVIGHTAQ
ncbi:MAG TPA: hypothetical protein VH593_15225, partial [Ktedonobacteraceae bacterium]